MCAEIVISFHGDTITTELDSEKEQEENKEQEKEKTSQLSEDVGFINFLVPSSKNTTHHGEFFWNSPSLDFYSPPPELI